MLPKWAGAVLMGGLALAFPTAQFWWLIPLGVLLFFPFEYVVHRWVYHRFAGTTFGKVVSVQHVAHHERPQDPDVLFNDPRFSIAVAVVLFFVYYGISGHWGVAASIDFGMFVGFLYYEWVHLSAHRTEVTPAMPWNRALKRYHLWHHFKHERHWYGVTTSVFDHLFGSWKDQSEVEMSATVRTLVPPTEHVPWLSSATDKAEKSEA